MINYINQNLDKNGFSFIREDALTRMEEIIIQEPNLSYFTYLIRYLSEITSSLQNNSNKNYQSIITRINNNLSQSQERPESINKDFFRLESMLVEIPLPDNETEYYDLRNIPDYSTLINELASIRRILLSDNSNEQSNG